MKKVIGTRIRKLRESKDYTQENMATELEITAGAYAKIERGETDPSITRLAKIAEILEVEVTSFFQDHSSAKVAEPANPYGSASKKDIDQLALLIGQLNKEIEKLKTEMILLKKKPVKKGK